MAAPFETVVVTAVLPWTAKGAAAPSSARQFNSRRDIPVGEETAELPRARPVRRHADRVAACGMGSKAAPLPDSLQPYATLRVPLSSSHGAGAAGAPLSQRPCVEKCFTPRPA